MGARGGLSGSSWAQQSSLVSFSGGTFFTLTFVHYHLLHKVTFSLKCVPEMVAKSIQNEAPNRYTSLLRLFVFFRALRTQNMCLGHACAVQITSGTDHMEHEMDAKVVRKGTQIHQEAWLEHRLEKTLKKVVHVLEMSEMCVPNGFQKSEFIFALCPLAPLVAPLALQSVS